MTSRDIISFHKRNKSKIHNFVENEIKIKGKLTYAKASKKSYTKHNFLWTQKITFPLGKT